MPSSDEDSISRWSQFLGHRDVSRPERPSSLDVQSIDTAIHVDSSHEQPATSPKQPRLSLRRKKGRIFDQGFLGALRKLSGNKSPSSSSDPEDAPNRPHIVPPLHDSSDPERYSIRQPNDVGNGSPAVETSSKAVWSAFKRDTVLVDPGCALTPHEKVLEIAELVQVRTASAGVTLQRLAELGYEIDGQERQGLLTIARSAADVALREYSRVCRTRPKAPLVHMLERNAEVPLLGVNDCKEYIRCLQLQAKELQNGVQGLSGFREASHSVENLRRHLDEISRIMERRDSAADMAEIQCWVERKCMFWAAVDILTANNVHVGQGGDLDC